MADLITLQEYKDYKGKVKTDDDEKISVLISSVSNLIKAYVGHSIIDNWDTPLEEEYTLPYDTNTLYLNIFPVREIVSVEEAVGGWVGGLDSTIHYPVAFNSDYIFDSPNGILTRLNKNWGRNIKVVYKAGYETTPPEIKHAAIELVSYYLNEEWKPTRSMNGSTMVGPTPESKGIPKHIQGILDGIKIGL